MVTSSSGRDVYLAFNNGNSWVAASHDFGATFSPPVRTNRNRRYWFHTGGAVAPDGSVMFATVDYRYNYRGEAHVRVVRSTDGGSGWSSRRVDSSAEAPTCGWSPGCSLGFFGPTAAIAVDPAGTSMLAYNAASADGGGQAMWARTSTDGERWSDRRRLSRRATRLLNAFAAVEAGPTPGDFRVVWQGERSRAAHVWNTWYRRTTDGGQSWGPIVRLSDAGRAAPYKTRRGYRFPYGDYLGLAVDGSGVNHVVWGEGRSFAGHGGTWFTRGR